MERPPYEIALMHDHILRLEEEIKQLKETNESLLSVQYKLADSNKKLRQCLTEIKEIICLELAYGTNEEYANFYMQQREKILRKVSEAIDED